MLRSIRCSPWNVFRIIYNMMIILQTWLAFPEATSISNEFTAINDCTCQGYDSVYECTVSGGIATIWKGTAFDCQSGANEIALLHSNNFTLQRAETCNNGAITGQSIGAKNGTFTSQLTVRVSAELNGSTIVCAYDVEGDTPVVGSALLTITTEPFPPPTDVELVGNNVSHLTFSWNEVASNCPSIQYQIVASNCGACPNTTLINEATCTGSYTQLLTSQQCSFAVVTVVCDNITGDVSNSVYVPPADEAESIPNDSTTGKNNMMTVIIIISGAVISTVMLLGITLILGLIVVYLIAKKSNMTSTKNRLNQRPVPEENMPEAELNAVNNPPDQEEQVQDSRDILYADIGPNPATKPQRNFIVDDDRVQYEEIRHDAELVTVSEAQSSSCQVPVNLDFLLILLKEEITPRWYEFGLVIGVPTDVMNGYLGHPSDQCLIELLDYWLRHHPSNATWKEVAQALKEVKHYHLAEKTLKILETGRFPIIDADINSNSFNFNQRSDVGLPTTKRTPPQLPVSKPTNHRAAVRASDYEDTAELLPPPLPPKPKET